MKICQILGSRGRGGLERHFVDLCNGLAQRHEVIAIAHSEFASRLDESVRFEAMDLDGWRHHPALLYKLYRTLTRHQPQIVHAQANKAAAMVGSLRRLLDAKSVATVHNLKRDTQMYRSFDRIIAVSHETAAQFEPAQTEVIYNGIEPPSAPDRADHDFLCDVLGVKLASPTAIAVGRLVPAKGFDLLLRAWKDIAAALVIVGEGPEQTRLENLIREYGLGDRVLLAGYRNDVIDLLASADLLVISSHKEGFSYVLAEALHVRRLAVATRVPVAMEILPEEFLVDCGDAAQLAATIDRVLRDRDAAQRAFAPVWEFAAHELTLARMVERTERLYEKLSSS